VAEEEEGGGQFRPCIN
jgi:hypothetical protein